MDTIFHVINDTTLDEGSSSKSWKFTISVCNVYLCRYIHIIHSEFLFLVQEKERPNILWNLKHFVAFICRSLNSNHFSGQIPPSIGNLSRLLWLDLTDNQLNGPIPISHGITPGLDMLLNARHLYVNSLCEVSLLE